ncbi:MAG TPA: DNA-binding protein WhiA [Symbiobacteriaceae bacterium]
MTDAVSFSTSVKHELAHLPVERSCCRRMEVAALLRASGRISISANHRLACILGTDSSPVARRFIRMLKSEFHLRPEVLVMRRQRLRKNLTYVVRIPQQPGLVEMLKELGFLDAEGRLQEWGYLEELEQEHCRCAYLRGTFLGTGWVASPERQHHLEMTTTSTEAADALGQLLFQCGIPVRLAYRKESLVLYVKDADQIAHFLGLVGAHQALLRFEEVRAIKEMKNQVNRQVNAETANLTKTVEAAARQVAALERLRARDGLKDLSEPLRELALLRLSHPDASLKELGEMCVPPVGKSGVNHRMRKLMELARRYENG